MSVAAELCGSLRERSPGDLQGTCSRVIRVRLGPLRVPYVSNVSPFEGVGSLRDLFELEDEGFDAQVR